jgi:hypothetical protein
LCGVLSGHIADQGGLGILLELHSRLLCDLRRLKCMLPVRHGFVLGRIEPQLWILCREHVLICWVGELLAVRCWLLLERCLKHVLSTKRLRGWHLRHSQLLCLFSGHILRGRIVGM